MQDINLCPICLDPVTEQYAVLSCRHKLHTVCFANYIFDMTKREKNELFCPFCKEVVIDVEKFEFFTTPQQEILPLVSALSTREEREDNNNIGKFVLLLVAIFFAIMIMSIVLSNLYHV